MLRYFLRNIRCIDSTSAAGTVALAANQVLSGTFQLFRPMGDALGQTMQTLLPAVVKNNEDSLDSMSGIADGGETLSRRALAVLGVGTFGRVRLVRHDASGATYAPKSPPTSSHSTSSLFSSLDTPDDSRPSSTSSPRASAAPPRSAAAATAATVADAATAATAARSRDALVPAAAAPHVPAACFKRSELGADARDLAFFAKTRAFALPLFVARSAAADAAARTRALCALARFFAAPFGSPIASTGSSSSFLSLIHI